MEEEIIEDSMNMESEETNLHIKVQQLEQEVKRLKGIIKDERSKNKELEYALTYFHQIWKRNKVNIFKLLILMLW